jgi:hypothetical protein
MDTSIYTRASVPTTCNAKTFFQFFALAAELRDMIYDHLWQDVEEDTDHLRFNICTTIPELRLVNRQFKSEYDEHIAANEHKNTVAITQLYDYSPCDPSKEVSFPRLAAQSTSLTINIISKDDDCGACHRCRHKRCEHSAHYREWVRHWLLADLPLEACQVNLSMASRRCVPEAMANYRFITGLLEHFGEFTNLNIFGPKSEKGDAGDPVLLATHSGVSTPEKRAAMLKLANAVAESLGEPLWY